MGRQPGKGQGDSQGRGMETAREGARRWPGTGYMGSSLSEIQHQQNNMSRTPVPSPPSYSYNPAPSPKSSRLYQHLLASTFLHDHIYNPEQHPNQTAASIRFTPPPQPLSPELAQTDDAGYQAGREPATAKIQENMAKTSHQATQSLGSNYSIIEIENESYSTLNLYSTSRHPKQPDLSRSSNLPHEPLNLLPLLPDPSESQELDLLLEGSAHRELPSLQQVSCLEMSEKGREMKKYRSEEFGLGESEEQSSGDGDGEEESPLPRLLAGKCMRKEINRKFSSSQASSKPEEGTFRTVLNEVYVVPYRINEQVQPYAFSRPADPKDSPSGRRATPSSLRLQNSSRNEFEGQAKPGKDGELFFSSHARLNQHRPQPILTLSPQSSEPRQHRPAPKACRHSHQKSTRANSIGAKHKLGLPGSKESHGQLDQSQVTRLLRQQPQQQQEPNVEIRAVESRQSSILYEDGEVSLCCGRRPAANKIGFRNGQKKNAFFCQDIPSHDSGRADSQRISSYRIHPLAVIKGREAEGRKRGIRLVGFNSPFQRKGTA